MIIFNKIMRWVGIGCVVLWILAAIGVETQLERECLWSQLDHYVLCKDEQCTVGFAVKQVEDFRRCSVRSEVQDIDVKWLSLWSKLYKQSSYAPESGVFRFSVVGVVDKKFDKFYFRLLKHRFESKLVQVDSCAFGADSWVREQDLSEACDENSSIRVLSSKLSNKPTFTQLSKYRDHYQVIADKWRFWSQVRVGLIWTSISVALYFGLRWSFQALRQTKRTATETGAWKSLLKVELQLIGLFLLVGVICYFYTFVSEQFFALLLLPPLSLAVSILSLCYYQVKRLVCYMIGPK